MAEKRQMTMDLGLEDPPAQPAGKTKAKEPPEATGDTAGGWRKPQMQDAHVLVPDELRKQLRANWRRSGNVPPVLKIFSPVGAATWLIHSADSREPDFLFGLCDLGMGFPELGSVSLEQLRELRVPMRIVINGREEVTARMRLERDLHFRPRHNLEVYADAAMRAAGITENPKALEESARRYQNPRRRR